MAKVVSCLKRTSRLKGPRWIDRRPPSARLRSDALCVPRGAGRDGRRCSDPARCSASGTAGSRDSLEAALAFQEDHGGVVAWCSALMGQDSVGESAHRLGGG